MTWKNEAALRTALVKELRKIPRVKAWKNNSGRRGGVSFGEKGSPDVLVIIGPRGHFVGIETKIGPGEEPSEDQNKWHHEAINCGATIIVSHELGEIVREVAALAGMR